MKVLELAYQLREVVTLTLAPDIEVANPSFPFLFLLSPARVLDPHVTPRQPPAHPLPKNVSL